MTSKTKTTETKTESKTLTLMGVTFPADFRWSGWSEFQKLLQAAACKHYFESGESTKQLAERFSVNIQAVGVLLRKAGVKRERGRKAREWTVEERRWIRKRWDSLTHVPEGEKPIALSAVLDSIQEDCMFNVGNPPATLVGKPSVTKVTPSALKSTKGPIGESSIDDYVKLIKASK